MSDDAKKIGLIVLIVVVIGIAIWSGMRSFNDRAGPAPISQAEEMRKRFSAANMKGGGTGNVGNQPGQVPRGMSGPGSPGAPPPGGTSGAPSPP